MVKKILIAEDEEAIVALVLAIFSDPQRYSVLSAKDGEEALQTAKQDKPDIILLDIGLPKMNGFEVCKAVKSNAATAHIKVMMLSGMVQQSDLRRASEMGADTYVIKPFQLTELVKKVEELLTSNGGE